MSSKLIMCNLIGKMICIYVTKDIQNNHTLTMNILGFRLNVKNVQTIQNTKKEILDFSKKGLIDETIL